VLRLATVRFLAVLAIGLIAANVRCLWSCELLLCNEAAQTADAPHADPGCHGTAHPHGKSHPTTPNDQHRNCSHQLQAAKDLASAKVSLADARGVLPNWPPDQVHDRLASSSGIWTEENPPPIPGAGRHYSSEDLVSVPQQLCSVSAPPLGRCRRVEPNVANRFGGSHYLAPVGSAKPATRPIVRQ
jgi:hypothetical protein